MKREFSAGGLVSKGGKVLLVKVRNLKGETVWTFPKGHPEKGETPLEAALREVEEETGWLCRKVKPLLTVGYRFVRGGSSVSKRVKWYSMEPVERVGRPDAEEVLETKWVPAKLAARMLKYPSDFRLLEAWAKTDGD